MTGQIRFIRFICFLFFSFFVSIGVVFAQDESLLSVERIFKENEFSSASYSATWNESGASYISKEPSERDCGGFDIVLTNPLDDQKTVLVRAEELTPEDAEKPLDFASFQFSSDDSRLLLFTNTQKVWRRHTKGDYWVLDRKTGSLKKLGGNELKEPGLQFAKFSPNGDLVAYIYENDIYVENLPFGTLHRITFGGGERYINGTFDWVYEEELDLRDGFRWSSDGKSIAFWQLDTEGVPVFSMIDNTEGLYPKIISFKYPKTGMTNSAGRIGIVDVSKASGEDENLSFKTNWAKVPGAPREHYITEIKWLDPEKLFLTQLNRLQNKLMFYESDINGNVSELAIADTDEAWIDSEAPIWLEGNRGCIFQSERSGWRRFWRFSFDSNEKIAPISPEGIDVIGFVGFDRDSNGKETGIYFYASPVNATQRYLYRISLDGTGFKRISPETQPGTHGYSISFDGTLAIHTFSSFEKPPVTELVRLPSHETVKILENNENLNEKLAGLKFGKTEFFEVVLEDGTSIDAWAIFPPDFDPNQKYPVMVYVYGEPAGQTVLDRWSGSGYLWHRMLSQKGYVVLSFDNRGTPAPKGRTWRKSIYRDLGHVTSKDQAEALEKTLRERKYLDPDRVGIWGWSGGGTSSLHALFRYPELYKLAIAVAPVAHERYYDTIYQERYLGLPDDNEEGYRKSSPITYAENMEGKLLLIHGTGDDNCHYQTTELLINELVKHEKQFQMMAYPNRSHSINEGEGTTVHLRNLMTDYIERNL